MLTGLPSTRFSKNEKAIIVGSLLGDGHLQQMYMRSSPTDLRQLSNYRTVEKYRLRVGHTKEHFDYLDWKYQQLKRFCSYTKPPYPEKGTNMCLFYTEYSDCFKPFFELFYSKERKRIPSNINEMISDPLVLAVWYLDDGTRRRECNSFRIATHSFTEEEHKLLVNALKTSFNIEASYCKMGKSKKTGQQFYGLNFNKRNGAASQLSELIRPIIINEIPSMLFKLEDQQTL